MGSATNLQWSCQMRADGIPRSRRVSPSFFRSSPARRVSSPNCCASALSLPRERSAPPLLMLAPTTDESESGDSVYEFYSLANANANAKRTAIHFKESRHVSNRDCTILGSAHGWLILSDSLGADVYLSDPVTHRHIKLPSLERFAGEEMRVILTSSPDDQDSRVILSFLPEHRLLSCSPGRSTAWMPLAPPESHEISKRRETDYYDEFACGQKLLFCLTDWFVDVWDLSSHPSPSPRVNWMLEAIQFHPQPGRSQQESNLKQVIHKNGWLLRYLLVDQVSNELFLVARYVNPRMSSDGSYAKGIFFTKYRGWDFSLPYKTFDFEVYKVDLGGGQGELKLSYMEDCLNGMVMFVGKNYSFAVTASEHPELKPNSIYFVDDDDLNYGDYIWNDEDEEDTTLSECVWTDYGGHDNGVFEYEKKSFSSLCDLCPFDYQSIKRMSPAPLWFAPSF